MTENPRHMGDGAVDQEIDRRNILKIGFWLTAVTVASFVIAALVYRGLASSATGADPAPSPIAAAREQTLPPGPQLEPRPEEELAAYRRQANGQLASWGWVDREAGIAHIPIDRAIEIYAADAAATATTEPAPAADGASGEATGSE